MLVRTLCSLALALSLVATAAAPAAACGHSMRVKVNLDDSELLVRAERLIDGDKPLAGLKLVRDFYQSKGLRNGSTIERRARRLAATAVVRLEGRFDQRARLHKTPKQLAANLAWAVTTLRAELKRSYDDPAVRMALGEALSRQAGSEKEALALLQALRDGELMVSGYGFAALARLEAAHGDQAAASAARERCAAIAGDAARAVCGAPAGQG